MKLRYSPTSPYVRKVVVLALERGLDKKIERLTTVTSPVAPDAALAKDNPLIKVPALTLKNGLTLFDSPVICEYLDSLSGAPRFFPASGPARWAALKRQALADGLMEAAVLLRYEQALRPEPLRWVDWIAGQQAKVMGALDAMESDAPSFGDGFDIGHIASACAIGYLDLRFGHFGWRDGRPKLATWFADVSKRPSLISTFPKG